MAGNIYHAWDGTILTITSDSGTSSADLAGDIGPRGPQGPAGIIVNSDGTLDTTGYATEQYVSEAIAALEIPNVDLTDYYTKSETNVLLDNVEVDLTGYATTQDVANAVSDKATTTYVDNKVSGYATETFVRTKIAEAQLGGDVDLSDYRTIDNNNFTGDILVTGAGLFNELYTGEEGNRKPVATQEWVNTAITNALAALNGSEVEY